MPSKIPKTKNLRQHPVLQALKESVERDLTPLLSNDAKPTLWLCCSGGRDSLGLVYAFTLIRSQLPCKLQVIHINHQLQQPANDWAKLVSGFCTDHELPCIISSISLSHGSENEARNARFQAIYQHIQTNDILVLGHHADDQAETVLMNLCKGTGLAGLSAMAPIDYFTSSHQQIDSSKQTPHYRFRPWLNVSRAQITDFCQTHQLTYVDDPTNVAGDNTRAFLRREILPKLSERWQKVPENIARTAQNTREAKVLLDKQISQSLAAISIKPNEINLSAFQALASAEQFSVINHWLAKISHYSPPRHIIAQIISLATADNNSVADTHTKIVWQHIQIKRYANVLYLLPTELPTAILKTYVVDVNTLISLPCGEFVFSDDAPEVAATITFRNELLTQYIGEKVTIRPVNTGERLHIEGRVGSWKIKKFFQSIKLPPWQRKQAQLICFEDDVLALLCHKGVFYTAK